VNSDEVSKIEQQIIHLMLRHREAVQTVANSTLRVEQFQPENRYLVDAAITAESRNVTLTRLSFRQHLEMQGLGKIDVINNEAAYNKCRTLPGVKLDDIHALIDKKRVHWVDSEVVRELARYKERREEDPVAAAEEMAERVKATVEDTKQTTAYTFVITESERFTEEWWTRIDKKRTEDEEIIKCGLPEFDDAMGIGLSPEALTVLVGEPGGYKTTSLVNMAHGLRDTGWDVSFFPLEMPYMEMYDKFSSLGSGVPFFKIARPKKYMTDADAEQIRAWQEKKRAMKGRLAMLEVGERTTVSVLRSQIERHLALHKPRVIVVDYVANLVPDKQRKEGNHLEIGDMLKDLIKMGKPGVIHDLGFHVITAAQTSREALKRLRTTRGTDKMTFAVEDVGDSSWYGRDATNIIGLVKDPARPTERLHAVIAKTRWGYAPDSPIYNNGNTKSVIGIRADIGKFFSLSDSTWTAETSGNMLELVANGPKKPVVENSLDFDEDNDAIYKPDNTSFDTDVWG
jgi:replicative DNA helicase